MFRKFISMMLSLVMVAGLAIPAFASENNMQSSEGATKADILELREYVIRNEDGSISIDEVAARANGANENAIKALKQHFAYLNTKVAEGLISIDEDLNIIGGVTILDHPASGNARASSCGGGVNSYTEYWWGYQRKACDCETQRIANDLNTVAAGGTIGGGGFGYAGGIVAIFGYTVAAGILAAIGGGLAIDAGYWWLVATRMEANNEGSGVICDMTYALVFDITPQ